jgi:hypothetical protein
MHRLDQFSALPAETAAVFAPPECSASTDPVPLAVTLRLPVLTVWPLVPIRLVDELGLVAGFAGVACAGFAVPEGATAAGAVVLEGAAAADFTASDVPAPMLPAACVADAACVAESA